MVRTRYLVCYCILFLVLNCKVSAIKNGMDATIEERPFQVLVSRLCRNKLTPCGGTILDEYTILTANHCIVDQCRLSKPAFTIAVGKANQSEFTEKILVEKFIEHENYNQRNHLEFDIAVLKLVNPLKFNERIKSIALQPRNTEVLPGTIAQVSGWGNTSEKVEIPDILKMANVTVIARADCKKQRNNTTNTIDPITNNMICATPNGIVGKADSGGPVTANGKLIGVISRKGNNVPDIYTNVSSLHDWIIKHTTNYELKHSQQWSIVIATVIVIILCPIVLFFVYN